MQVLNWSVVRSYKTIQEGDKLSVLILTEQTRSCDTNVIIKCNKNDTISMLYVMLFSL